MNATRDKIVRARSLAVALCGVLLFAACGSSGLGMGDRGHGIYFHNATGQPITLYELGRDHPEVGMHRMKPDERFGSSWAVPDNPNDKRTVRVEAVLEDGTLVYCHIFSWDGLEQVRWRIEVVRKNDCT
jgi:hypothetical protein